MPGFTVIKREQAERMRLRLSTFAVRVSGIEPALGRSYVIGQTIPDGSDVRVTVPAWRNIGARQAFARLKEQVSPGGVIVFANCERNRNGTYEAAVHRIVTRCPEERFALFIDDPVRIAPVYQKDGGVLTQTVQRAVVRESVRVTDRAAATERVFACLSEEGIDRPGAIIRGVDEYGNAMAVSIVRAWDWDAAAYCSPEETIERFLRDERVRVSGVGVIASGCDVLNYIDRFSDASWEVMPMRQMTMGLRGWNDDRSTDYRYDQLRQATGFVPSLLAAHVRPDGGYYVAAVFPTGGAPLPMAYLPSAFAAPEFAIDEAASEAEERAAVPADAEPGVDLEDLIDHGADLNAHGEDIFAEYENGMIDITKVGPTAESLPVVGPEAGTTASAAAAGTLDNILDLDRIDLPDGPAADEDGLDLDRISLLDEPSPEGNRGGLGDDDLDALDALSHSLRSMLR